MRLVLASGSPRRRDLLTQAGLDFEVIPSTVDEDRITRARPVALARALARAKARDVAASHPDATVLAADTIVVHRGTVLGKPRDAADARAILGRLRGRRHRVITGVCLIAPGAPLRVTHVTSGVVMRPYGSQEVEAWIARGGPFDRAGAYAIQDADFQPVASFEGCYCNVVGLPLWVTLQLLAAAGIRPSRPAAMPGACDVCVTKPTH